MQLPEGLVFKRAAPGEASCFLFVGGVGPGAGVPLEAARQLFHEHGGSVLPPKHQATHLIISFESEDAAQRVLSALRDSRPFGKKVSAGFAKAQEVALADDSPVASTSADRLGVPGLLLVRDFVGIEQEAAILAAVDAGAWVNLAKRRVQHYGYAFDYAARCFGDKLGPLPAFAQTVASNITSHLLGHGIQEGAVPDQLTVNEYVPGVGLSPHIDTHSAFTGAITSLSLGGPCVMEFRNGDRRCSLALPPRSLLVMSGEARYAWQHYIPHRKSDWVELDPTAGPGGSEHDVSSSGSSRVPLQATACPSSGGPSAAHSARHSMGRTAASHPGGQQAAGTSGSNGAGPGSQEGPSQRVRALLVPRSRRVSLTFRQVRGFPCACQWPDSCDSQASSLPPSRLAVLRAASSAAEGRDTPAGASSAAAGSTSSISTELPSGGSGGLGGVQQSAAAKQCMSSKGADQEEEEGDDKEQQLRHLEQRFVVDTYDAIASHFSATRFSVWPKVREFIQGLPRGAVVADVGCGNGKYFGVRRDIAVIGSDRSTGLAGIASRRLQAPSPPGYAAADVVVADALDMPLRPGSCDAALCIAVLHHMSSVARRLRLLRQLADMLAPGGRALVTVWAAEQEDPAKTLDKWQRISLRAGEAVPLVAAFDDSSSTKGAAGSTSEGHQGTTTGAPPEAAEGQPQDNDFFVPWHLPLHRSEAYKALEGSSQQPEALSRGHHGVAGGCAAVKLDARKNAVVMQRYYHLFVEGELESLVLSLNSEGCRAKVQVLESFYDKSNWCVVFGPVH